MSKVVNIYPAMPITTINPPIRSRVMHVSKTEEQIRACIMAKATVEEIFSDGKTVRLDLSNYDKDNSGLAKKEEVKKPVEIKNPITAPVKEEVKSTVVEEKKVEKETVLILSDKVEVKDEAVVQEEKKEEEPVEDDTLLEEIVSEESTEDKTDDLASQVKKFEKKYKKNK